jgi:type I restriction enzyme S subunit
MKKVKVSELAKQIRGVSYKPENLHEGLNNDSVVLLRANNIDNGKINFDDVVYVDKSKVSAEQYLRNGDVLICASSGSKQLVGKAASVGFDKKCTFGAFCKVVRPDSHIADYLGTYFQSGIYRHEISKVAMGANINNIRNEHIDSLELPVRTPTENADVVKQISLLQSIIEKRKKELQKLNELIKARFVELFGDIIINEKGWRTDSWVNVLKITNGRNQKAVESEDGEYLICGSGGAMGRAKDYLTNENSVILGRKGNINKPILMREKYWNVDTAFGIEPNKEVINVDYFYMFCLFFNFEKLNKAVTIPSLRKADLLNIEMAIPDMDVQVGFADFVRQVDKSKFGRNLH